MLPTNAPQDDGLADVAPTKPTSGGEVLQSGNSLSTEAAEQRRLDLLLYQHKIGWAAFEYWAKHLDRLCYWFGLIISAAGFAYISDRAWILPLFALALPAWLYLYLRGSFWYEANSLTLMELETLVNSLSYGRILVQSANEHNNLDFVTDVFRAGVVPRTTALLAWLVLLLFNIQALQGGAQPSIVLYSLLMWFAGLTTFGWIYRAFRNRSPEIVLPSLHTGIPSSPDSTKRN